MFGLFLVEAAYLKAAFEDLPRKEKRQALVRSAKAGKRLDDLQSRMMVLTNDPQQSNLLMARERVRCPLLLDSGSCTLYAHRPIT